MKLLIHIGTHKTATTSIQHFCALNKDTLKTNGFLYPQNNDSAYVYNFLASRLAYSKKAEVEEFMKSSYDEAKKEKCDTVVISAESFFAMTVFFQDIHNNPRQFDDYWENEKKLIQDLKDCCSAFSNIQIACYFRPQDELASSLYNQFIKNVFGISDDYEGFLKKVSPVFDYNKHVKLWENAFGQKNVSAQNFISCIDDPIHDFCSHFLSKSCFDGATKKEHFSNTRLNRDVLEFKRIYNRTAPERSEAFVTARCFRAINDKYKDQKGYQVFAPYSDRLKFFEQHKKGNDSLTDRHNIENIPTIRNTKDPKYSGLSLEKAIEINWDIQALLNKPKIKYEISLRRLLNFCDNKVPMGHYLISFLRRINNSIRLRFSGW